MESKETLEKKYNSLLDSALENLKEEDWWNKDFEVVHNRPSTKEEGWISISKKTWNRLFPAKEWDEMGLWLESIRFPNLFVKSLDDEPNAYIHFGPLEKKDVDLEKFTSKFKKYTESLIKNLEQEGYIFYYEDDPDNKWWPCFYIPGVRSELIKNMKERGTEPLIEKIVETFNTLAKFIDPFEKTLKEFNLLK